MGSIITIDGPAGSGKSTVSRMLAKKIQYVYLDTGAMYRAVALAAVRADIGLDAGIKLGGLCRSMDLRFETVGGTPQLLLNKEDISTAIRSPEMDLASSTVSAVKEVREAMTHLQRKMAQGVNIVAEGRDMGSVVYPNAEHKFFLTAAIRVRAERRYSERVARGELVFFNAVSEELQKRDHQDETRALAPLKPAEDAVIIDSTGLTPEMVVEKILECMNGTGVWKEKKLLQ